MRAPRPGPGVYAGLFVVTASTLMHEILLTRIFSVTMWYHFAFMAVSVALFGMTVGALVVYLRPERYAPERASAELARSALAYAGTLVLGFALFLEIPFLGAGSAKGVALLALSYVVIAVPFVFSGITVAVALTRFPPDVGRLYAADLVGAAAGCALLVYLVELAGGITSVLLVATFVAAGALLFACGAPEPRLRRAAAAATAALALAAAGHHGLAQGGAPLLEIVDSRGRATSDYRFVRWNSHSRVTVAGEPDRPARPEGWGLSRKTQPGRPWVRQLEMTVDTWASTVLTHFDGDLERHAYLKDDVTNLAHHLRRDADVFVVGVGGGRDVLSALVFGQRSVTGVEINADVLEATTEAYGEFTGHLEARPRVSFHVDEARSFITRSEERYDIVQLSLIDTWAATGAGAFVLSENSVYTREAWTIFLQRLEPDGLLSVSRWYYAARPAEALRLTSLARAALDEIGAERPREHVALVNAPWTAGRAGRPGHGVATILVSPSPLSTADRAALRREAERLGFELLGMPGRARIPEYARILSGEELGAFYAAQPLDVTPPSDDRPFFFQMLRFEDLLAPLDVDASWADPNRANLLAIKVLGALLAIVTVLTLLGVLVPLAATSERGVLRGAGRHLAFFLGIGLGFMFVEISQMQRLMVFLGHPTYALSVVLFTLLVGGGLGSALSARLAGPRTGGRSLAVLGLLLLALGAFGLATPWVIERFAAASTPVRVAASSAILLALGLPMGTAFPIGLRAAAAEREALTPWLWGVNGAASVLCSVLAVAVALRFGIAAAFWAGVACYGVAFLAHVRVARAAARAG